MTIAFWKAEACGNDFLFVAEADVRTLKVPVLARTLCHRRTGVGADGLIVFGEAGGRFVMKLFNSDGSSAEISGNGLRCLGALLVHRQPALAATTLEIATGAGPKQLMLESQDGERYRFRADMGPPMNIELGVALEVPGRDDATVRATTLSMGNPHCVVFADPSAVAEIGPLLECHPHFPDRTNVELVRVTGEHSVEMKIWERGAGLTASSGTGSAASAVAAIANGRARTPVRVHCPGGTLEVEWTAGTPVSVTGDASVVANGSFLGDLP